MPTNDNQLQCGHPVACVVSADEDRDSTGYCGWCASLDKARDKERERCAVECDMVAIIAECCDTRNELYRASGASSCARRIRNLSSEATE